LFTARNKHNITLRGYGAKFVMRKEDYRQPPYTKTEWRHCLSLRGYQGIKVYGWLTVAATESTSRRGAGEDGSPHCQNIHIKDVACDANYRQGISVITAYNLLIENCTLRQTEGTAPQAGIDFELNRTDEQLVNCVLRNCLNRTQRRLRYPDIYVPNLKEISEPISIIVENCHVHQNDSGASTKMPKLAVHISDKEIEA